MSCSRTLFDDVGGFDETFRHYGGEDWEFAHRAVAGGAVLHHARTAVAWHDGSDWAERDVSGRAAAKNFEALALARRITDPDARRPGLRYALPDVAVEVDTTSHGAGSLMTTLGCFLHEDVGIWLVGDSADRLLGEIDATDQRVHLGPVPDDVRRRCRLVVATRGRLALPRESVTQMLALGASAGTAEVQVTQDGAAVVVRSAWALNRARRWSTGDVQFREPSGAGALGATTVLSAGPIGLVSVDPDVSLAW